MRTGPLENQRQERFAQNIAKGMTQLEAYAKAGYKPDDGAAARLSGNVRVRMRIVELQARAAEKAVITAADIATQLDEDRTFAKQMESPSAMVAATMGKAKVLGLIIEKHAGADGGPIPVELSLSHLTAEQLSALASIKIGDE